MRRLAPVILFGLLGLALIAADCKGDGMPTPTPSSGIQGMVTIGPMCPVERIDTPCPDQPYEATIIISDQDGHKVTTIRSGADGTFRVALAPATYTLHPVSTGTLPFAADQEIAVTAGAYSPVEIQYDSGIR